MSDYYILDEQHNVVPAKDVMEWAKMWENGTLIVDQTRIDDVRISTVFLGLNHGWHDHGPPIVFETMIFGGAHDDYQERYATWDEAVAGHATAVALVRADMPGLEPDNPFKDAVEELHTSRSKSRDP